MKNQIKKKLEKINKNLNGQKIIKEPIKLLKKIDLKSFGKAATISLTKTYKNFKKKQKIKEINRNNVEKKEKIKIIKKEK